jgi:rSAM/selenodomain-associated transferase 2
VAAQLRIGVVIPTLNEAAAIVSTLDTLQLEQAPDRLVVSDGGSVDDTVALAQSRGATVISAARGRGPQLESGRRALHDVDVHLFLHADTRLGPGALRQVRYYLMRHPSVVGGAFRLGIDAPDPIFRWIEQGANLRSGILGLPYGDQAIFARSDVLRQIGGVPSLPLMEDVELMRRLGHRGRIAILNPPVRTSARRWRSRGVWSQTARNLAMITAWQLGADPHRLARHYPLSSLSPEEWTLDPRRS